MKRSLMVEIRTSPSPPSPLVLHLPFSFSYPPTLHLLLHFPSFSCIPPKLPSLILLLLLLFPSNSILSPPQRAFSPIPLSLSLPLSPSLSLVLIHLSNSKLTEYYLKINKNCAQLASDRCSLKLNFDNKRANLRVVKTTLFSKVKVIEPTIVGAKFNIPTYIPNTAQ